jgi:hypothetical protein
MLGARYLSKNTVVSFRAAVWVYKTRKDLRSGRNIQVM